MKYSQIEKDKELYARIRAILQEWFATIYHKDAESLLKKSAPDVHRLLIKRGYLDA